MRRQVIDGLIIAAVLALGATHLFAQASGGRRVLRPNEVHAAGPVAGGGGANRVAPSRAVPTDPRGNGAVGGRQIGNHPKAATGGHGPTSMPPANGPTVIGGYPVGG